MHEIIAYCVSVNIDWMVAYVDLLFTADNALNHLIFLAFVLYVTCYLVLNSSMFVTYSGYYCVL